MTNATKITVETTVAAPIDAVWQAWNTPADIKQWNAASDDWHTVKSEVDLRAGGAFSSRMEAKDGSMGFDFAGTYTRVEKNKLIEAKLGDRDLLVEFIPTDGGVTVRETFDAETSHPVEAQRQGWQSILNNFAKHVQAKPRSASTANTYLAVFLGSKTSPKKAAWEALPEADRRAQERAGMAAWHAWVEQHQAAIVSMGGPLGKTKKVSQNGIEDVSNAIGAFSVVRAQSPEAAAKLFENHPHFAIFPGDSVEIMPVLPIPGV